MTKEELIAKISKPMVETIEIFYENSNADYELFINNLNSLEPILVETYSSNIKEVCEVFEPFVADIEPEIEMDEEGYPLDDFLINNSDNHDTLIAQLKSKPKGWITDEKEKELLNSVLFKKVIRKNLQLNPTALADVVQNSLQILGRANNPNIWDENKQGLVMGMVQSGKTMSMLTLMGMGMEVGYDLIILLAGTKEDLRRQSQKRINDAFNLHKGGYSEVGHIYSPTFENRYTSLGSPLLFFQPNKSYKIIITVLKESKNLADLINDINNLKSYCKNQNIDFSQRYRTLILDDEADNAGLEIKPQHLESINKKLRELRDIIPLNCYVGYTATPQGCMAAKPDSTVGYPKDFLWLLEPMKLPGNPNSTLSYMGLNEYFIQYKNDVLRNISRDAWPHHFKDDKGKRVGTWHPIKGEIIEDGELAVLETEVANYFLKEPNKIPYEYYYSIIDYLIGCGLRWYRHFKSNKPGGNYPNLDEIIRNYPYHAMMFNLSLTIQNQEKTTKLVEKCFTIVSKEFNKWIEDKSKIFKDRWVQQLIRTKKLMPNFTLNDKDKIAIQYFIKQAIAVTATQLNGKDRFIYQLNSSRDGDKLDYNKMEEEIGYIKKAAIFVGGNILSRGLTIENLSVSFFVRTQAITLGDTSLQMCRWFGHKKMDIDIISLYLMDDTRRLFKDLARCDSALRLSIKNSIIEGKSPLNVLIELWSSNLFNVTSNVKKKELKKQAYSAVSYTGSTRDLREPFCGNNLEILKNTVNSFDDFIQNLNCTVKKNWLDRGDLYLDVNLAEVTNFLKSIKIPKEALFISPESYAEYLEEWFDAVDSGRIDKQIPKINIGVMTTDSRKVSLRSRKYDVEPLSVEEAKTKYTTRITALLGGSRGTTYKGDKFFEMDKEWHKENFWEKYDKKEKYSDTILILFYKLDPNYLGNFKFPGAPQNEKIFLNRQSEGIDVDWVLSMAAHTPDGGPMFKIYTNQMIIPVL